jgi:dimethylglycine dehydrogenase
MSDRAQVVIIRRAGIAGVSSRLPPRPRGWTDVLLLERDELTSGSTWHAAGNVPTFSPSWALMRLQQYSAALYRQLAPMPNRR